MHTMFACWEAIAFPRAARNKAPLLLPVTHTLASSIRERYGKGLELQVIPNPVSLERFCPGHDPALVRELAGTCSWIGTHFTLLFVGADFTRKGLADVIRAVATVSNTGCLVVGAGNSAPFEALAESLGIRNRVTFLGKRTDVDRLFRVANAFVLPSHYEALPIVCLEALASGLPLILAPFPGYQTVLTPEVNGYLANDWKELACAVRKLAEDPELAARLGSNSRALADRFSAPKISEQVLKVLKARSHGSSEAVSVSGPLTG